MSGEQRRIMVVDDDSMAREYIEELLSSCGYDCVSFADPRQALEVFARDAAGVALIISDIRMPGISGTELARKAVGVKADIPIIF
jgi:CheY-like chemotaxis protein